MVFGVNVLDLDFWVQIDSIEQPIKSNSLGSGNMSHCLASSLYDHLDHCFVFFKDVQQSFLMRKLDVSRNKVNIIQNIEHSSRLLAHVILITANNGFPRSIMVLSRVSKDYTIRFHKSRVGIPSNLNPASKEMISDSVVLWETEVFFLHIQLFWNKCMTTKNAQCSTRSRFWVLKISCKIGVLKQSQSVVFCSITHMTILFLFTCVMNVRYQSIQAFVTGFGSFRNRSCKFVHWPWSIRSSNTCQVEAFQNNLRASFWQHSHRFQFFLFEVMVIDAWVDTL